MAEQRIPVVILCGGAGTRLAEQTETTPKPLVEIGGRPIVWHIMKHYSRYGFNEFALALGHKGDQIKRYFLDYRAVGNDLTISLQDGKVTPCNNGAEPWTVHLIDTGESTPTGGRFMQLEFDRDDRIRHSKEKSTLHEGWINEGSSMVEPAALTYIGSDVMWEHAPLEGLAHDGQLVAYRHEQFWQCMDTLRDLRYLESLWDSGSARWRTWS